VPIERADEIIQMFDVGLCPYGKNPGTNAASPMRLLHYTAAGIPTVCTDLAEVRRMKFPNVVLVEDNSESLANGIEQALRLPRVRPQEIDAYDLRRLAAKYEKVIKG
jgi:hypothetical protein